MAERGGMRDTTGNAARLTGGLLAAQVHQVSRAAPHRRAHVRCRSAVPLLPLPHLRRDWAHPPHTSLPGLGSPRPHLRRDFTRRGHLSTGNGMLWGLRTTRVHPRRLRTGTGFPASHDPAALCSHLRRALASSFPPHSSLRGAAAVARFNVRLRAGSQYSRGTHGVLTGTLDCAQVHRVCESRPTTPRGRATQAAAGRLGAHPTAQSHLQLAARYAPATSAPGPGSPLPHLRRD